MNYTTMEIFEPVALYQEAISPNTFILTPERGHVWLQRAALWVLRKLGCNVVTKTCSTTLTTVNEAKLLDDILEQMTRMRRWGMEPDVVILGNAAEGKIIQELRAFEYTSAYEGHIHMGRDEWPALYGVNVRVVPWFKGALVVPKPKAVAR